MMLEKVDVYINHFGNERYCGQLVKNDQNIFFKYDKTYLAEGFNLSPIKLAFDQSIQKTNEHFLNRMHGVFCDSLPDGWGQLLMRRFLNKQNVPNDHQSVLLQLTCLNESSKGALVYRPAYEHSSITVGKGVDELYMEAMEIYQNATVDISIDDLFLLGGSSGGARPKVDGWIHKQTGATVFQNPNSAEYDLYLIKFKSDTDFDDIAPLELSYMQMAKQAGLEVADSRLIVGKTGNKYFATKRFDRMEGNRKHQISVAGLLHDDYRQSNVDYGHIMDAAFRLRKDLNVYGDVLRLAVFNILSHNMDDHSKNIAFLTDEEGNYHLSPAYDLTFSYGINHYRSTSVAGQQLNPTQHHIKELAHHFGYKKIDDIIESVYESVKLWPAIASDNGVSKKTIDEVEKGLNSVSKVFFSK